MLTQTKCDHKACNAPAYQAPTTLSDVNTIIECGTERGVYEKYTDPNNPGHSYVRLTEAYLHEIGGGWRRL